MSDQNKSKSRNFHIELDVIIIDGISMVSDKMLLDIRKWLCETFACSEANSFPHKTILLLGDLFQLPSVKLHH